VQQVALACRTTFVIASPAATRRVTLTFARSLAT
jgi:hypothetical protein